MNLAGREAGENHLISEESLKQQLVKCYDIKMVKSPGGLSVEITKCGEPTTTKKKQ